MEQATIATIETDADIERGLTHLRAVCPVMEKMASAVAQVPLRRNAPGFASLAKIVVSQQVSVQSANAIWGSLVSLVDPLTPEAFIAGGETAWVAAGLSRPKQRTLRAVCDAIGQGDLRLEHVQDMAAADAVAHMVQVKGIGPWTAEVYLLFAVGHPDIFPAGDLALQNAARDAYGLGNRPAEKELRAMSESWAPWRGVAARLFWAYYAVLAKRDVMP
ncbi:MAG: DNA-3-methyladenine glycosylase 2 family protein [Pseudomonadota bacterium]